MLVSIPADTAPGAREPPQSHQPRPPVSECARRGAVIRGCVRAHSLYTFLLRIDPGLNPKACANGYLGEGLYPRACLFIIAVGLPCSRVMTFLPGDGKKAATAAAALAPVSCDRCPGNAARGSPVSASFGGVLRVCFVLFSVVGCRSVWFPAPAAALRPVLGLLLRLVARGRGLVCLPRLRPLVLLLPAVRCGQRVGSGVGRLLGVALRALSRLLRSVCCFCGRFRSPAAFLGGGGLLSLWPHYTTVAADNKGLDFLPGDGKKQRRRPLPLLPSTHRGDGQTRRGRQRAVNDTHGIIETIQCSRP